MNPRSLLLLLLAGSACFVTPDCGLAPGGPRIGFTEDFQTTQIIAQFTVEALDGQHYARARFYSEHQGTTYLELGELDRLEVHVGDTVYLPAQTWTTLEGEDLEWPEYSVPIGLPPQRSDVVFSFINADTPINKVAIVPEATSFTDPLANQVHYMGHSVYAQWDELNAQSGESFDLRICGDCIQDMDVTITGRTALSGDLEAAHISESCRAYVSMTRQIQNTVGGPYDGGFIHATRETRRAIEVEPNPN